MKRQRERGGRQAVKTGKKERHFLAHGPHWKVLCMRVNPRSIVGVVQANDAKGSYSLLSVSVSRPASHRGCPWTRTRLSA